MVLLIAIEQTTDAEERYISALGDDDCIITSTSIAKVPKVDFKLHCWMLLAEL